MNQFLFTGQIKEVGAYLLNQVKIGATFLLKYIQKEVRIAMNKDHYKDLGQGNQIEARHQTQTFL